VAQPRVVGDVTLTTTNYFTKWKEAVALEKVDS